MLSDAKIRLQFLRFIAVGLLSTTINYGIFSLLYGLFGFYYLIASFFGFISGVMIGYPINKYWTFGIIEQDNKISLLKYISVYICSLILGQMFLYFFVEYLGFAILLANFFMICITTVTNFIGIKLWVFYSR